jgi:DNA invertase Pin-like site-specific DNA recombinase
MDGIARAKAAGVHFGKKPTLTPAKIAEIRTLRAEGLLIRNIMERTGLSKASVYRALGGDR